MTLFEMVRLLHPPSGGAVLCLHSVFAPCVELFTVPSRSVKHQSFCRRLPSITTVFPDAIFMPQVPDWYMILLRHWMLLVLCSVKSIQPVLSMLVEPPRNQLFCTSTSSANAMLTKSSVLPGSADVPGIVAK